MRASKLASRLTIYYLSVTGLVFAGIALVPDFQSFLPIGGAKDLLSGASSDPFDSIEIGAESVSSLKGSLVWLTIAVCGALLSVWPLSWTYMAIRTQEEYDQSLVETIMILPIAVTSIVIMVHQSVALAFGLAGIVGGVRFRNTLKSSGDALFILSAIGIGLAAGIGALEIAIVLSISFNFCFLVLWMSRYGERKGAHRYMRHAAKKHKAAPNEENSK